MGTFAVLVWAHLPRILRFVRLRAKCTRAPRINLPDVKMIAPVHQEGLFRRERLRGILGRVLVCRVGTMIRQVVVILHGSTIIGLRGRRPPTPNFRRPRAPVRHPNRSFPQVVRILPRVGRLTILPPDAAETPSGWPSRSPSDRSIS